MNRIRLLLVEDHELIRGGLRALLEQHPDITVVGEGASGEDALRLAETLDPDVVLMDLSMPGMNGLDATARLASQAQAVAVVSAELTARTQ